MKKRDSDKLKHNMEVGLFSDMDNLLHNRIHGFLTREEYFADHALNNNDIKIIANGHIKRAFQLGYTVGQNDTLEELEATL